MSEKHRPIPSIQGLRLTKHRKVIYDILLEKSDHPTASEVYDRARKLNPDIALATVYNSLEALVEHGVAKQVNFEREPSRYCANVTEHGHFHDTKTGEIHDIAFKKGINPNDFLELPKGVIIENLELTLRGKISN